MCIVMTQLTDRLVSVQFLDTKMIHFAPECCRLASIHGLFTVYSRSILSTYLLYFLIFIYFREYTEQNI